MTVVPLLFGNSERAAANFIGIGGWVGIIVGIVAIIEKMVVISKNKGDAVSRKASSAAHEASTSYQAQPAELSKGVSEQVEDRRQKLGTANVSKTTDECKGLLIQLVVCSLMLVSIFLVGILLDATGGVPEVFERILPLTILIFGGGMLIATFRLVVNGWSASWEAARMIWAELSKSGNGHQQSAGSQVTETQNRLFPDEVEELSKKISFMKGNRELIENGIVEYMTAHPDESSEDVVDTVTEKCFLEYEIKGLEVELEAANARFGEQSNSLKPLGNLTYEEASRYFNEYCDLLIKGCGIREKESCLPTSFDRMKEALKVECLNWCNLGEDFDESWELIGKGVIRLSCFVPDELAEKTRKLPDSSNLEELRAYLAASRAADEIIERRTNELNVEWDDFRSRYRKPQIPESPSLPIATHPQRPAPVRVSNSESDEATRGFLGPSPPDALITQKKETDCHDAKPVSFQPKSEASNSELSKRPSDSCKASTKRSETRRVSVFLGIGLFLLIGILIDWNRKSTQTVKMQFDSSGSELVEQESRNNIKNAQKSDFLEMFKKVEAEIEAAKHFPPKDPSADELDRRTGNAIASSSGRSGQIDKFLRESINQMVALRNQYQAELYNIGWDRLLDPGRIALDTRLVKSKAKIRQAKEIVDKYEKQVNALLDNMRNDINKLNLSANEKAKARDAFERGTQESSQTRNQIWQLERAIVWKCGEMIEYLYSDYGYWSVSDGQMIFSNNEKAAAYNRHLEAIEKLVAQEEQLRRYGAQKVEASLDPHRLTFDCSTDEAYKRSYESILAALSPIEQEKLNVAVLELEIKAARGVDPSSQDFVDVAIQRISQLIGGKNAAEVIELAAQMRAK